MMVLFVYKCHQEIMRSRKGRDRILGTRSFALMYVYVSFTPYFFNSFTFYIFTTAQPILLTVDLFAPSCHSRARAKISFRRQIG